MPKEEWGTKRTCPKCAVRFYDLNRDPLICPNCGATFDLSSILDTFKKAPRESSGPKTEETAAINPIIETDDLDSDAIILEEDDTGIELEDELLEEEDEDSVSLEVLTDVPTEDEDN